MAALGLVLQCLSLSENHHLLKINDLSSLKLVEIFLHLSLDTQASTVLQSILPRILSSSDMNIKAFAYYLWAQTKILKKEDGISVLNILKRAESGNQ